MMWQPSQTVIDQVIAEAERTSPRECCGLVRGEAFIPILNVAPQNDAFLMEPKRFIEVMKQGPVDAVAHSHVYLPPIASELDLTCCERSALPWLIVSIPTNTHTVIRPSGFKAPLVGRSWAWGVHDCFALVRDGMAQYGGITIPDIHREWEFWRDDFDFIRASMEGMGFVELEPGTPFQHLDVVGMRIHGRVINHLGLFVAPDGLLHQFTKQLSRLDLYGGVWQGYTELHARHRDLMGASSGT